MNRILRISGLAIALAALAGCSKTEPVNAPVVSSGTADFGVVAAIGTSVSAGFESGGLVVHHQQKAFPYGFARQVGAPFTIPSISADGFPALLRLVSLVGPVISNAGRVEGTETNRAQVTAFHNMGVPGSVLADVMSSANYGRDPGFTGRFFDIVVRGRGTIMSEVLSLNPTFVTFEMGANEVLGPASKGSGTPVYGPATYASLLTLAMNTLAPSTSNVKVALFTVPDITSIPYFTTIKPVYGTCPLLGSGGPLAPDDDVLLPAGGMIPLGYGVPTACGGADVPLPDSVVLLHSDQMLIQAAVAGFNAAIDSVAQRPNVVKVDLNALLKRASTTGIVMLGQLYTSAFVSGGLFSLDGIHPTDIAHGVICNALIDAVNAKFGARIPPANLADFATPTAAALRPASVTVTLPRFEGTGDPFAALTDWRGFVLPGR